MKLIRAIACVLALTFVLTACNANDPEGSKPTGSNTAAPTAQALSGTYVNKSASVDGIDYNIYEFKPDEAKAAPSGGGTDLASGKSATSSGSLSGFFEKYALDGNLSTLWASVDEPGAWFQVDLEKAQKIGRIEVVARQDGDQPGGRVCFEIQASNDATFKTYDVIASQGAIPFESKATWVANSSSDSAYRYVRLKRTFEAAHMTMAEFRVFDAKADLAAEDSYTASPDGAMMIMSATGKTLTAKDDKAFVLSYDFIDQQRWFIEQSDGNNLIKNAKSGLYLTCKNGALSLQPKSGDDSQRWLIEDAGAGWSRITAKSGGVLVQYEGALALASKTADSKYERWDISQAYDEKLQEADMAWMKGAYGVMMHILPDSASKRTMDRNLNVTAICDQLKEAGADYFMLSVGQMSGYFLSANERFSSIVTAYPTSRSTQTDFVAEFAKELKKRDIKLMLYITTEPPNGVVTTKGSDIVDFGMGAESDRVEHTRDSAMLWASVIREWSEKYGDLISGWWIDGGPSTHIDREILTMVALGAKSGNQKSAVAYNSICPIEDVCEYVGGEIRYPFGANNDTINDKANWVLPSTSKDWDGKKLWTSMTFIGYGWQNNDQPRTVIYPAELWGQYAAEVKKQGGFLLLDVPIDIGNGYTIPESAMEILREVNNYTK